MKTGQQEEGRRYLKKVVPYQDQISRKCFGFFVFRDIIKLIKCIRIEYYNI